MADTPDRIAPLFFEYLKSGGFVSDHEAQRHGASTLLRRRQSSGKKAPLIMTVEELAELLRVDKKTVYESIQRNEIDGVRRIGKAIRIHRPTVLRWLSEGQGRVPRSRKK